MPLFVTHHPQHAIPEEELGRETGLSFTFGQLKFSFRECHKYILCKILQKLTSFSEFKF